MRSVAKYGRYVHLEKMLQGSMRVTPASEYKSATMTAAQQDDELKKSSQMPPMTTIGSRMPNGKVAQAETIGRITKTTEIRRTFYMTSFTECGSDADALFIAQFPVDARLVIHNPVLFGQRVCMAAQRLHPKWIPFFATAHYFDPDTTHPDELASDPSEFRDTLAWRLKESKYAWQREWRFIWLPDKEPTDLSPIVIPIGSITDIAVLERLH